jgi:hypothetical protein
MKQHDASVRGEVESERDESHRLVKEVVPSQRWYVRAAPAIAFAFAIMGVAAFQLTSQGRKCKGDTDVRITRPAITLQQAAVAPEVQEPCGQVHAMPSDPTTLIAVPCPETTPQDESMPSPFADQQQESQNPFEQKREARIGYVCGNARECEMKARESEVKRAIEEAKREIEEAKQRLNDQRAKQTE